MERDILIAISVSVTVILILLIYSFKLKSKIKGYEDKYSKIIDIDKQVEIVSSEKNKIEISIEELRTSYKNKKSIYDKLVIEAAIYDEDIQLAELGFYKAHYDYDASEKFKDAISAVKDKQKALISKKSAIYATTVWTVDGSKAKGQTMANRGIRLTARAFNNECDSAISNTAWNNAERMEKRIEKAFDAINRLNESNSLEISSKYLNLKIEELRLTHEYREKKQQEKEEQAEIKRQMREEVKLQQEVEKTLKEEEKYKNLLEKAKTEASSAEGAKLTKLEEKTAALSLELAEAHTKSERAVSMAQQTKSGHIYVISNIGSFGESVYKIGMTRRLEPLDRVKELGDASVPFIFDVHAMIYSDDAPALENTLHKMLESKRLNLVNNRKEFFHTELENIEKQVKSISPEIEFIETAEAREYRESMAIRLQREQKTSNEDAKNSLPDEI